MALFFTILLVLNLVNLLPCRVGATNTTSLGKPISIPPSQFWDGKDGPWSTFRVQIGTPPQQIHILPAIDQSSTWLVIPEACQNQGSDCIDNRGNVYERNMSTSWEQYGSYELNTFLEGRVGQTGSGLYGYDTIQFGWLGDNLPTVTHQVISGIITTDFYLGSLALNPRPMNFTDYNDPIPSLLESLKTSSTIPSTSWSYTAGANNLAPKSFGSLVLGGYDSTRFAPNNVTFPFGSDISLDFQVAVQSITTNASDQPLLNSGIISYIDTLVAEIWLPMDACQQFEETFGLVWDNKTELYLLNDTLHEKLLAQNPIITFQVGPAVSGESTLINLPYWNFYLTATSDYVGNSSGLYFPLKRAANDSQYILGRAFLQSAHISADYDRNTFNLSQALYPSASVAEHIVTVLPPTNSTSTNSSAPSQVPIGAIAGAAAGGAVVLILLCIVLFMLFKRRKARKSKRSELEDTDITQGEKPLGEMSGDDPCHEIGSEGLRHEVKGDDIHSAELYAEGEHAKPAEVDGDARVIYEMPAEDVVLPELEGEGYSDKSSPTRLTETPLSPRTSDTMQEMPRGRRWSNRTGAEPRSWFNARKWQSP